MISIIISTLNNADGLRLTLDALKSTSNEVFEVIVIDGESTDSTIAVLNEFGPFVKKWISEKDSGIYDAWNKGLQMASGEFIAFLGGGDYYINDGLEKLIAIARENPQATFISGKAKLVQNGITKRIIGKPLIWEKLKKHMTVVHVGALHSKRLFTEFGCFDKSYKVAGDYEFLLRSKKGLNPFFLDQPSVVMQMGGVSQSGRLPLIEIERAKLSNGVRARFLARFDRLWAECLLLVRSKIISELK